MKLRFRPSNARGYPVGQSHHRAKYSDQVVAEARALRRRGWTVSAIGDELHVPRGTVEGWTSGRRRQSLPVRVIAQLVKPKTDN